MSLQAYVNNTNEQDLKRNSQLPTTQPILQRVGQKKPEVYSAQSGSRIFYVLIHAYSFTLMIFYKNSMYDALISSNPTYPLIYGLLFVLSAYLFWTCGENPGYAPFQDDEEMQPVHRFSFEGQRESNVPNQSLTLSANFQAEKRATNSQEAECEGPHTSQVSAKYLGLENKSFDINQKLESKKRSSNANHNFSSENNMKGDESFHQDLQKYSSDDYAHLGQSQMSSPSRRSQREREERRQLQSSSRFDGISETSSMTTGDQEYEEEYVAQLFYCAKCKLHQPFRSRHCDDCGRCILKFDHHCFWIGGCIGELNHRKFWLFLFFQTISIVITFNVFFDGLDIYTVTDEKGFESYTQEYCIFAILCFFLFIFILFTGALCAYHGFLILSNQTTWEHQKKNEITYTRHMPQGFYPFSQGIFKNIEIIFNHGGITREWSVPTVREAKILHQNSFNICENQYYSCC